MKIQVKVDLAEIHFDRDFTGDDEDSLFRQFRQAVEDQLGFFKRAAVIQMDDEEFIHEVVMLYNHKTGSQEPIPTDISGFFDFADKAGFITLII